MARTRTPPSTRQNPPRLAKNGGNAFPGSLAQHHAVEAPRLPGQGIGGAAQDPDPCANRLLFGRNAPLRLRRHLGLRLQPGDLLSVAGDQHRQQAAATADDQHMLTPGPARQPVDEPLGGFIGGPVGGGPVLWVRDAFLGHRRRV